MLTDAIRSLKFKTDPDDGSCRSEDGGYALVLDTDGRVRVRDADGKPTGASWKLPRKPVFLQGFHSDPLTGDCLGGRGAYGFTRGPAGLVHVFDRAGKRSDAGTSDVAAGYIAAAHAPKADLGPAAFEGGAAWFVRNWPQLIPPVERHLDRLSPDGDYGRSGRYVIVREGELTTVANHSSPGRSKGIFTVTMERGGGFHMRFLDDGPNHADLLAFAEELHRHHFGKKSTRPREHDGFVRAFRSTARKAKGVVDGPTPNPDLHAMISAMLSAWAAKQRTGTQSGRHRP